MGRKNQRLRLNVGDSLAGGLRACRRGAAATELALVLPLLTTLIMGVLEYGTVIYSYSRMQFAATRVARTIAVNRMTNAEAEAAITASLPGWMAGHVEIDVAQSAPGDPLTNLVRIQVAAPAQAATPFALMTRAVPWQLTSDVTMKQELPYVD